MRSRCTQRRVGLCAGAGGASVYRLRYERRGGGAGLPIRWWADAGAVCRLRPRDSASARTHPRDPHRPDDGRGPAQPRPLGPRGLSAIPRPTPRPGGFTQRRCRFPLTAHECSPIALLAHGDRRMGGGVGASPRPPARPGLVTRPRLRIAGRGRPLSADVSGDPEPPAAARGLPPWPYGVIRRPPHGRVCSCPP